jgi:hypothetical protein
MIKRWYVVRHVRWIWHSALFELWWWQIGQHIWIVPNQADFDYLERVWRGEA